MRHRALLELATSLESAEGNVEALSARATELASQVTHVPRVSVWLLEDDDECLRLLDLFQSDSGSHRSGDVLKSAHFPRYFAALRGGRMIAADQASYHPATAEFHESYLVPHDIKSMLDAAIRVSGKVVGVVCFEQTGECCEWTQEEQDFAAGLADQVSHALLNRSRLQANERERIAQEHLLRAQKFEALGQLAGAVAHDFNNLLTIITGFGLELQERARDEDRADLQEILNASDRASELVRGLLDYSRYERLEIAEVDLVATVAETERMLERLLRGGVTLSTNLPDAQLRVRGTVGLLQQIMANLVVNARDAIEGNGQITITVRRIHTELPRSVGGARLPPGSYAELTVRDTGSGMPPEVMDKIFDPFFTTKRAGVGTGLGLSTVLGIVERCGGAVSVSTELGKGTEITVSLPLVT